jgi:Tol biopolymer transport system component
MSLSPGTRFGSYSITEPLGAGGMGEVYRARDTELGRDVAIKVLPESFTSDAARVARFEQEAKVLAALNHPNIAHIYGLERSGATTALAIELVEGPTLVERIDRGRLPVDEALAIATQIAAALEAAHERGIVHRDLKPANIKLAADGTVKVLDFGIAKGLDMRATSGSQPPALATPAMTETGIVLGTAAYMSPEQARGLRVDQRTDIWAFGCVLYEMLTGKAAFLGEDVTSTLARVLEVSADLKALPSSLPPAVRRTLELCFEKDPRKRIADMRDVRLGLAGAFIPPAAAPTFWRRALPSAAMLALGALLTAAYFIGVRGPSTSVVVNAPPSVMRFVITPPATAPLASLGGLDLTISPDGKRIAYFARKPNTENVELYVRELDALEARPIPDTEVTPQPGTMNPFFSADGKSIGFHVPGRGVMSVGIDGRPSVKIMDSPLGGFVGAHWSADNHVIYSSGNRLQRVSASGGGRPEPLMPEREGGSVVAPVLLPGGRGLLFRRVDDDADGVAVLDLISGEEKMLVPGGSNPAYADTGHIVFVRGSTLMAVPFSAAELAVTGEPVALVQGVRRPLGAGAADYALSANGTLVYVPGSQVATAEVGAMVWVDRSGAVTERAVRDSLDLPRDPRLSPDGTRLLLVTGFINDGDVWSYDLSGRPPIPLALPNDNRFPVWSPDGTQVAFSMVRGLAVEIVTLPADGSTLTPQSLRRVYPAGGPHVWSETGELILAIGPTNPDIVSVPTSGAGDDIRAIVASDYREFYPALSPDGRWLAYVSNRTGREEIWVQGYPNGAPVRVSSAGGSEPQWSADGRELFFRVGNAMMVVAVQSGDQLSFATPEQLFSGPYTQSQGFAGRSYAVARDGRFLMIQPDSQSSELAPASIVVVQNFTEEIKLRTRVP